MDRKKRSGGPRTPEGKLAASKNAIKTGAYSATVILPGENEQDFLELKEQFIHDFDPQDIAEAAMVHELAVLTWKRLRLERLEHAALIRKMRAPMASYERSDLGIRVKPGCDWLLEDLSQVTPDFVQWHKSVYRSASNILAGIPEEALATLPATDPEFVEEAIDLALEHYDFDKEEVTFADIQGLNVLDEDRSQRRPFVPWAAEQLRATADEVFWVADHVDEIKQGFRNLAEARLLKELKISNAGPAGDDLSRAFHRNTWRASSASAVASTDEHG